MFTHTVDEALHRFNPAPGVEIAIGYDHGADNPLEYMELKGFAIKQRNYGYSRFEAHDPDNTAHHARLHESAIAEALLDIELSFDLLRRELGAEWWLRTDEFDSYATYAQDVIYDLGVIDESSEELKGIVRFEYTAVEEYGAPVFDVAVDTAAFEEAWGPTGSDWMTIYKGLAKDYAAWAHGSVYTVGVETEDDTDYMSGVYIDDPFDEDVLIGYAKDMGYDL